MSCVFSLYLISPSPSLPFSRAQKACVLPSLRSPSSNERNPLGHAPRRGWCVTDAPSENPQTWAPIDRGSVWCPSQPTHNQSVAAPALCGSPRDCRALSVNLGEKLHCSRVWDTTHLVPDRQVLAEGTRARTRGSASPAAKGRTSCSWSALLIGEFKV